MTSIKDFPRYIDVHGFAEITVDDFGKWMSFVGSLEEKSKTISSNDGFEFCGGKWVYRGQADAAWPIMSTFEREYLEWFKQLRNVPDRLRAHELSMLDVFRQKACGYVERSSMSNLEWLALMRHYGVPTRFVDFSESPLVAAHFAMQPTKGILPNEFAVWAVMRDNHNNWYHECKNAEAQLCFTEIVRKYKKEDINRVINDPDTTDSLVQKFQKCSNTCTTSPANFSRAVVYNRECAEMVLSDRPSADAIERIKTPMVYVYPRLPNARMRAQSGLFLMPMDVSVPFMESLYKWEQCPKQEKVSRYMIGEALDKDVFYALSSQCSILKFVFRGDLRHDMEVILGMANVNAQTIAPDLEGVAEYVRHEFERSGKEIYDNPIKIRVS